MKIKDIVNRDIVNLTNCEHEPIHIPGSIQPHGFLIAIDAASYQIKYCSANIEQYLACTPSEVLSKNIDELFDESFVELIETLPETGQSVHPYKVGRNGQFFNVLPHKTDNTIILDCEADYFQDEPMADIYDQTSRFLSYMHQTSTLQELCEMVARGTREITGYDRVMIYQFDKDYNGEVIAEDVRQDLEPFLGLHYPHTDIPIQARTLYLKNQLRLIYDVNYQPVPIFTAESNAESHLDLSHSILRSTSPIHVQYLQNMGVVATLTISLLHKGKLWGLIACHHYSPKNISHRVRLAAQLQGHFITSQIDVRQLNAEYEISKAVNNALENLSAIKLTVNQDDLQQITNSSDMLKISNATGAVIIFNNQLYKTGIVPSDTDIQEIADRISTYTNNSSLNTEKLIDIIPNIEALCGNIAGVIYHELAYTGNSCVMWFRGESISEVNWAGDPSKAIVQDEKGLSPRNSFELYKEVVKCVSSPWLQPELSAAANFAHILQKHANFLVLSSEEARYRELSEILKTTNLELENINWISTHDLQEPLRKMQLASSRILFKEQSNLSSDLLQSLTRINNSASKMQDLLVDILKYTRIDQDEDVSQIISLNEVVTNVLDDLKDDISTSQAQISVAKLPDIKGSSKLLSQVFYNLLENSITFSSKNTSPKIEIFVQTDFKKQHIGANRKKHYEIIIKDNGLGFDNQFATSIFNVFTKVHTQEEIANNGSGIGLAVVKKIMGIHGGSVEAESEIDNGATFHLFFPI